MHDYCARQQILTLTASFAANATARRYIYGMVGDRIRETRLSQRLSLAQVAEKADISAATLSRIETNKQNVDLGLFLTIARVLNTSAKDLLGEDGEGAVGEGGDPLVRKIAALDTAERTLLWRQLADSQRQARAGARRNLSQQVEELLAQVEFLHQELLAVKTRVRRR
jgi:transcriptional regulator with XRE-family HTH domain